MDLLEKIDELRANSVTPERLVNNNVKASAETRGPSFLMPIGCNGHRMDTANSGGNVPARLSDSRACGWGRKQ